MLWKSVNQKHKTSATWVLARGCFRAGLSLTWKEKASAERGWGFTGRWLWTKSNRLEKCMQLKRSAGKKCLAMWRTSVEQNHGYHGQCQLLLSSGNADAGSQEGQSSKTLPASLSLPPSCMILTLSGSKTTLKKLERRRGIRWKDKRGKWLTTPFPTVSN